MYIFTYFLKGLHITFTSRKTSAMKMIIIYCNKDNIYKMKLKISIMQIKDVFLLLWNVKEEKSPGK